MRYLICIRRHFVRVIVRCLMLYVILAMGLGAHQAVRADSALRGSAPAPDTVAHGVRTAVVSTPQDGAAIVRGAIITAPALAVEIATAAVSACKHVTGCSRTDVLAMVNAAIDARQEHAEAIVEAGIILFPELAMEIVVAASSILHRNNRKHAPNPVSPGPSATSGIAATPAHTSDTGRTHVSTPRVPDLLVPSGIVGTPKASGSSGGGTSTLPEEPGFPGDSSGDNDRSFGDTLPPLPPLPATASPYL